jgi:hypothetical protein
MGAAGGGAGKGVAQGSKRCHHVGAAAAPEGTTEEMTSWRSARVIAT